MAVYNSGTVVKKIGDDIYGKIVDGSGWGGIERYSFLKFFRNKPDNAVKPDNTTTVMFMKGIGGLRNGNRCANYTIDQMAETFAIVADYGAEISRIERELASVADEDDAESAIRAKRLRDAKQYLEEICSRHEKPTISQESSLATN